MTFAQALARIEELSKSQNIVDIGEKQMLLSRYANSFVQLGKVAREMRARESIYLGDDNYEELSSASQAYDRLMGEGK